MADHREHLLQQARATRADARQALRLSRVLVPPGIPSNLAHYAVELDAKAEALERRAAGKDASDASH